MPLSDYLNDIQKVIKRDDIRGVYGDSIDVDFAYKLGLSLAGTFLSATTVMPCNVVVGHDMRLSGPVLAKALCEGLDDGGCRAISMGRAGTELAGFLPAKYSDVIDGGVIITASHNPKDNNGFKFFGRAGLPLSHLRASCPPEPEDELHRLALGIKKRSIPTRLRWNDFAPDYILTVVERGNCHFEAACTGWSEPMKIAVEAGNGMGGKILREFAERNAQFDWTFSNENPDGAFPLIVPNPLNAKYQAMVKELVLDTGSHMGICFDGDADRVAVADENGNMLSPPHLTALVGQRLRQKLSPDVKIAFNLATSWVVPDTLGDRKNVLGDDALAVITPVGYGRIKPIMFADERIAFGAEHSGHYLFREFWGSDSGMLAGLLMLELAAELHAQGRRLSEVLVEPRAKYCESGEINFQLPADRPGRDVIREVTEVMACEAGRIYVVSDGRVHEVTEYPPKDLELEVNDVRAEAEDWWYCMRTSGTEAGAGDLLRLYVEAVDDKALMEAKRDKLVDIVGGDLRI